MGILIFVLTGIAVLMILLLFRKGDKQFLTNVVIAIIVGIFFVAVGTYSGCSDGWASTSIGRQGACSHHGGVKTFLNIYGTLSIVFSVLVIVLIIVFGKEEGKIKTVSHQNKKADTHAIKFDKNLPELYDIENYKEQQKIENIITDFIKTNFWYYLSDVLFRSVNNDVKNAKIPLAILKLINEEKKRCIEFPNSENRRRGGGPSLKNWREMTDAEKKRSQINISPISKNLNDMILFNLTPRIASEVLSHFNHTSVSKVVGYNIKTKALGKT